jgi:hypothetical protein
MWRSNRDPRAHGTHLCRLATPPGCRPCWCQHCLLLVTASTHLTLSNGDGDAARSGPIPQGPRCTAPPAGDPARLTPLLPPGLPLQLLPPLLCAPPWLPRLRRARAARCSLTAACHKHGMRSLKDFWQHIPALAATYQACARCTLQLQHCLRVNVGELALLHSSGSNYGLACNSYYRTRSCMASCCNGAIANTNGCNTAPREEL